MLLDQVFDKFEPVKWVYIRKNGKLKRVRRVLPSSEYEKLSNQDKPLFPISKERK